MSSWLLQPLLAPPPRLQGWDTTVSVRPCHTAQTSSAFKETNASSTYLEKQNTKNRAHKKYCLMNGTVLDPPKSSIVIRNSIS